MKRQSFYNILFYLTLTALLLVLAPARAASQYAIDSRPRIIVQPRAVVQSAAIRLGDIATVTAHEAEYQKLVEDLKQLLLAEAPPPMSKTSFPGGRILDAIETLGISRDAIGYSIPQVVEVERAGRVLHTSEILTDARESLSRDPAFDLQVREIVWEHAQIVPAGDVRFQVERLGVPSGGKVPLRVVVTVDEVPAARFLATAVVDDWREVPVLNRVVDRGMLIGPSDISLVRMNLFRQPSDIAESADEVIGRAVRSRLSAGEPIRKSLVDIPPLVPQGKKVTMLFEQGALRATATGTSLDAGLKGDIIRVRNDASRRVVQAEITSAEEVQIR